MEKFELSENIREKIVNGLEDVITDKEFPLSYGDPSETIEKVRKGEKVPFNNRLYAKIVMIGQDQRLSPEEIEELANSIFEENN